MMRCVFRVKDVYPYIPDYRRAFEHFCVHAGGRAVLEEMQRSLSLRDSDMEPSKSALHRFGNTSSSSHRRHSTIPDNRHRPPPPPIECERERGGSVRTRSSTYLFFFRGVRPIC